MTTFDTPSGLNTSDEWLFGWDEMPGIVSVWADRTGRAFVWQRQSGQVRCHSAHYRPWLYAFGLDDLSHLGSALVEANAAGANTAPFTYRELDGPTDSLRYLLTAQDGRALHRAILEGASRRLGKPVEHLRDLYTDYYSVGPVEQYLMETGRVYFRGLAYPDLHRLQFDLETTSLSPKTGRIFMVAVRDSQGLETMFEAARPDQEAALITDLCALIRQRDPDIIENHNLFGFDLPFLEGRAQTLGVPLRLGRDEGLPLLAHYDEPAGWGRGRHTRYSLAGRELIDTLDAVRRHDFVDRAMASHGLKAAARHFGLASPDRTYIEGSQIYQTYQNDPAQVRRYAFDDVREVDGLSQRLMGAAFALSGMAPRRYERVASAGPATGLLEPLLVRAYFRSRQALPRNAAGGDRLLAPHQGGATILYAAGVARRVVKADIASMYPSIMRTFGIGPKCDPLKAMLYFVERLTDLRLHHKQAARTVPPQSVAWQEHNALQTAMKIVINSAYGYMGAGQMALFADRKAADAVTRKGREILGQVVEELRGRGMTLLEADTDGVFFGVPAHWTETDERELVTQVAQTLPSGLKLEYEGRYQAMLSHEVKNYALLTYEGRLIVRGGALHSSRSEPFAEQFLRDAIHCTLIGDCEGLQQLFLKTIADLRARRYAPDEVATIARLTKTAEEYFQKRKRTREAAYEALLNAGRTRWRVGERVRFYRAEGGRAVWLPQPSDNERSGEDETSSLILAKSLPPYDVANYLALLQTSYVSRLRKAFAPDVFEQIFRQSGQAGLFDQPVAEMQPLWL